MYSCPECGCEEVARLERCKCGADLTLLNTLSSVSDAWFNQGLAALSEGQSGRALEWLAASCAANPNDSEAALCLAKVWVGLGHRNEAERVLKRAAELDPDNPELKRVRTALAAAKRRPVTRAARTGTKKGRKAVWK